MFFKNYWIAIEVVNINWIPEHISLETSKKVGVVLGQNFYQIRSNVMKKVKKLTLSIAFSHILHGEYILKQEVVAVQTTEWKFKANIGRDATFEGC